MLPDKNLLIRLCIRGTVGIDLNSLGADDMLWL
jgi:hypothetical protein